MNKSRLKRGDIILPTISDYKIDNKVGLPLKSISDATTEALEIIEAERTGKQLGLYCRYPKINRLMGKYFRFGQVSLFFSLTGHGKSYFLNDLLESMSEFEDMTVIKNGGKSVIKALNRDFEGNVIFLHACYEMSASNEVIRTIGRKIKRSHSYMLSSQYDVEIDGYNILNPKELNNIKAWGGALKERPIFYMEIAGTLTQLYWTAYWICNKNPNAKLLIALDHTLLTRKRKGMEKDDNELIANTAHMAIRLRKDFGAMVLLFGQMNVDITKPERKRNAMEQHPKESDCHGSNQLGWACDNIWCAPYRPEKIYLPKFGKHKLNTKGLVVMSKVKGRHTLVGDIYMEDMLYKGKFKELTKEEIEDRKPKKV